MQTSTTTPAVLISSGLICLTNIVKLERMIEESKKAFALIDAHDAAIKGVVTQVTSKTTEHDLLLQNVDTALRA